MMFRLGRGFVPALLLMVSLSGVVVAQTPEPAPSGGEWWTAWSTCETYRTLRIERIERIPAG